jgi:Dynamin family
VTAPKPRTAPAEGSGSEAAKAEAARDAAAAKLLKQAIDANLAVLRKGDPDAAADLDQLRRRELRRPGFAIVGETKRGKSSLVNALIGVPNLSPVDAAVATSSFLEFSHGERPSVQAYLPGREDPVPLNPGDLRDWGTILGRLPEGIRPPRRIEVRHPAPVLKYLSLVDTPGVGGLDSMHAEIAMDAVSRCTALLFVVDASSPFSKPELNFLIEASKRVNFVVFALTKVDAYPGWRTILDDNIGQLEAHARRFAKAPWFPVSARLAEMAINVPAAREELIKESRIGELQHALINLAGKGHLLIEANVLRALRSEFVRMTEETNAKMVATDPDPGAAERAREERSKVASRKRTESRQWQLALSTETQRARVEATARLRTYISELQDAFLTKIDKGSGSDLKQMPEEIDRALQALSVRLSQDLEWRFRQVGERVLAQIFTPQELQHVLRRLNARLRHALATKPQREKAGGDGAIVVMSSASMAVAAGRYAATGAGALGLAGIAGAGLVLPVVGIGLGLAAGAFMVWKRKSMSDKVQQRTWLREVLNEARAALSDEVANRFTDLQYALTLALDDAIERRLQQLDAHIADIDKAMAEDKQSRAKKKAALQASKEALLARLKSIDEVVGKIGQIAPASPADVRG